MQTANESISDLVIYRGEQNGTFSTEAPYETALFFGNPHLVNLVNCETLDQGELLVRQLELTLYPPHTKKNEDFHLRIFAFAMLGWSITSVPVDDLYTVEAFVNARGRLLSPASSQVYVNGELLPFPFTGRNFWHIRREGGLIATR